MSRILGEEIAARCKKRRLAVGLSQKEVAAAAGLGQAQVSKYETGRVIPTVETVARLAVALKTSLDYLVFGKAPIEADRHGPRRPLGSS